MLRGMPRRRWHEGDVVWIVHVSDDLAYVSTGAGSAVCKENDGASAEGGERYPAQGEPVGGDPLVARVGFLPSLELW